MIERNVAASLYGNEHICDQNNACGVEGIRYFVYFVNGRAPSRTSFLATAFLKAVAGIKN
jgi:hypothetical protein